MITINLIVVGTLKEKYLLDAQAEYLKRLSAFCKFNLIELSEHKLPQKPSQADIDKAIHTEGEAILRKTKGYVIALCIEGKQISSEQLAEKISEISTQGESQISLIIGGSYGLSDSVKNSSNMRLSMSKMTFPHQLARIMLEEQVYRAFSIQANTKYHK